MLLTPECAILDYLLAFFNLSPPKNTLLCYYKLLAQSSRGQRSRVSRPPFPLCVQVWHCIADNSLDQESEENLKLALSAINNAFGVHSDDVQDSYMLGS